MVLSESRLQVRRTQQWPDSGAPLSRSFMTTGQQGFSLKLTRLEEASVSVVLLQRYQEQLARRDATSTVRAFMVGPTDPGCDTGQVLCDNASGARETSNSARIAQYHATTYYKVEKGDAAEQPIVASSRLAPRRTLRTIETAAGIEDMRMDCHRTAVAGQFRNHLLAWMSSCRSRINKYSPVD
ncbi:uncharacterized protein BO96DRAFT_438947 [Aspergillus niger CBS 101883]|uniref:Uncharacterized protein n=2 Tax=Aspergillus niger TaxID=5061 RepID=A2QUX8_ASPNC|nr:uncharacterized protein BO96DRAFT_438947 [Aspergillus niger CBS 101883]XP_059605853.1 hypothetical protein An10g00270 [Aspergillus niger]PYH51510.1 hypothetical protein BO96DRAFT_438947 [Aspergillus niger CBS 101883]CAK49117.1 hypothetical protein An10g00270 [Aspergillus niger]